MTDHREEEDHRRRVRALQVVCGVLGGRHNLIATDFAEVGAESTPGGLPEFVQSPSGGVRVHFVVSHHALGKIATEDSAAAMRVLRGEADEVDR